MKIVCFIGPPPYLHHFVNEIAKHHDIELVIREKTPRNQILKKIFKKGILTSIKIIWYKFKTSFRFKEDYDKILTNWQSLASNIKVFNTPSINDISVKHKIKEINPDIIIVHGTTIIKNHIIDNIPLVLNLHWGLSPYYRGSYCTEWAILNNDPLNIGYTIHKISNKIDGGEILTQSRISIDKNDTANKINMKLTKYGTDKMIEVIHRLKNNETLVFYPQNDAVGNLYLTKHWSFKLHKKIRALEKKDAIFNMTKNTNNKPQVIIEY